jgi:hypothetical protein
MVSPTAVNETVSIDWLMFPKASFMLAYNSIPTTYEGDGVCGICFDESARSLPKETLKNGWILDIAAAEILSSRGVDVGLESIGARVRGAEERFLDENLYILARDTETYDVRLKQGAQVLSEIQTAEGCVPASYRYENADGNRFLVLNFNTRSKKNHLLKHYARGKQIAESVAWLSGEKLPAYSYGNPNLYIQAKKGEDGSMAVGLWNFFADSVLTPVVELDLEYSSAEFVNCTGHLDGNRVTLSELPAFGFAFFEVK